MRTPPTTRSPTRLDDDAGGLFAIHATTGVVTVNAALDYETATSHAVTVRATSSDGSFSTQGFSISVTDVNESGVTAINDTDAAADDVLENAANGTAVGITALADDAGRHGQRSATRWTTTRADVLRFTPPPGW